MSKGKSTWKYNKLLTPRRKYFLKGGSLLRTLYENGNPQLQVALENLYDFNEDGSWSPNIFSLPESPVLSADERFAMYTPTKVHTDTSTYKKPTIVEDPAITNKIESNNQGVGADAIAQAVVSGAGLIANTANTIAASDVTQRKNQAIASVNNAQKRGSLTSMDQVVDSFNNTPQLRPFTKKDMGAKSGGTIFADAIVSGLNGSATGWSLGNLSQGNSAAYGGKFNRTNKYMGGGPIGAIIGGVLETGTSLIGNLIRNHKAGKAAKEANQYLAYTTDFNDRYNINSADNVINNQMFDLQANSAAYGGPIDGWDGAIGYSFMNDWLNNKREEAENKGNYDGLSKLSTFAEGGNIHIKPSKKGTFTAAASKHGMGVQEFASKVLANKEDYSPAMIKKANFAKNASKWKHALGGNLMTHGADWDTHLNYIANGRSHEENPYQGVPMGVDQEGTPNLVEEGETIWNDYVFSRRLMVPKAFKKKYKLGGNLSFADASLKLAKESEERPNDSISQRGLEALMSELAQTQEEVKARRQQREMGMYAFGGKVNKFDKGGYPESVFWGLPESIRSRVWRYIQDKLKGLDKESYVKALEEEAALSFPREWEEASARGKVLYENAPMEAVTSPLTISVTPTGWTPLAIQSYSGLGNSYYGFGETPFWIKDGEYTKAYKDYINNVYDETAFRKHLKSQFDFYEHANEEQKESNRYKAIQNFIDKNQEWYDNRDSIDSWNISGDLMDQVKRLALSNPGFMHPEEGAQTYLGGNSGSEKSGREAAIRRYIIEKEANGTPKDPIILPEDEYGDGSKYKYVKTKNTSEGNTDYTDHYYEIDPDAGWSNDYHYDVDGVDTLMGDDYNNIIHANDLKQVRAVPKKGNSKFFDYYYAPNEKPDPLKDDWRSNLRGISILNNLGQFVNGLITGPDFSVANAAIDAANNAVTDVGTHPIGDYVAYEPFDVERGINTLNAQFGATDRNLLNTSSGNMGTARAGLLANAYNYTNMTGDMYRQAREYNRDDKYKMAEFNRGTNIFNAEDARAVELANQSNRLSSLNGMLTALNMKQRAQDNYNAGMTANLNALFETAENMGSEAKARNQINWLLNQGWRPMQDMYQAAHGGKLKRVKRKGLTY